VLMSSRDGASGVRGFAREQPWLALVTWHGIDEFQDRSGWGVQCCGGAFGGSIDVDAWWRW
jgi:hypothetical protein